MNYAEKADFRSASVRTPDTDIFFILLFHAHNIKLSMFLDIGTGKQRQIFHVSATASALGNEYSTTLLGFCVFQEKIVQAHSREKRWVH